jgi:hypothetical protein
MAPEIAIFHATALDLWLIYGSNLKKGPGVFLSVLVSMTSIARQILEIARQVLGLPTVG